MNEAGTGVGGAISAGLGADGGTARGGPSSWGRWWPAGFLLAGVIFGLTYLRAWSGETSGVHLMFWAAIATIVIADLAA